MTPAFILAQMAGLVALVILIISFREKAMARLLNLQIFSSLAYALQYFLLGAYSGLFKCLTCVVRNFIFSRYGKQRPPVGWLAIFLGLAILFAIITYVNPISLLPMIAFALYTVAAWSTRVRALQWAEIISCILFIVYNFTVGAYTGLLAATVELIGVVVVSWQTNRKARSKTRRQTRRKRK